LPGARQLGARSPDEAMVARRLFALDGQQPSLLLLVADATQLGESLSLPLQALELGIPAILAVNQIDAARALGIEVNAAQLSKDLGIPTVLVSAWSGEGIELLRETLTGAIEGLEDFKESEETTRLPWLPTQGALLKLEERLDPLVSAALPLRSRAAAARWLAAAALCDEPLMDAEERLQIMSRFDGAEPVLETLPVDRFRWLDVHLHLWVQKSTPSPDSQTFTDRIDKLLLHPLWGALIALSTALIFFQSLFSFADPFVSLIESGLARGSAALSTVLPEGLIRDALIDGVFAGVGNVLVFIPQLFILFSLLALLEGCGYLARGAALIDRVMRRLGLNGRAFIPILSGYACAVPAILAARSLPRRRDRQLTLLTIPLTTCSARLPVYTLFIAALIPAGASWGPLDQRGLALAGLYLLGAFTLCGVLALLNRVLPPDPPAPMLLELPDYRLPRLPDVWSQVRGQLGQFIREAGRVILVGTMILWVLLSFPRLETVGEGAASGVELAAQKSASYAGQLGQQLEPILSPLGWNWEVGVGLIGAFAAREVFVSTMGLVYGVSEADEESVPLREKLAAARRADGSPLFTPLSVLSLLVFFTIAFQCLSTLAVLRRTLGGWHWPLFALFSLNSLAWVMALIVYQGGRLLGFS
ncbi:MAG: ferrous iron transport protein B, partial [Myxococcota bacterium]|nr:ferrous iron transport protein B [Myxococcota bacterium]